jgi:hypothetical protein
MRDSLGKFQNKRFKVLFQVLMSQVKLDRNRTEIGRSDSGSRQSGSGSADEETAAVVVNGDGLDTHEAFPRISC